ncbi:hypothetical protein GOP47_0007894 [Adiantum capillus-veneris]|uniref:Uncharacterized protein n=1 Tax=Adiantum capillus-veneris TaxID=13818 RepID=A0A9D4ZME8_ADICA|nr:hypothetical protein GOP47_0007894 [Adiantum capillus-veneris]
MGNGREAEEEEEMALREGVGQMPCSVKRLIATKMERPFIYWVPGKYTEITANFSSHAEEYYDAPASRRGSHAVCIDVQRLLSWDEPCLQSALVYLQLMLAWGLVDEVAFITFKIHFRYLYGDSVPQFVRRVPFPLFQHHFSPALNASSSSPPSSSSSSLKISFECTLDRYLAQQENVGPLPWSSCTKGDPEPD